LADNLLRPDEVGVRLGEHGDVLGKLRGDLAEYEKEESGQRHQEPEDQDHHVIDLAPADLEVFGVNQAHHVSTMVMPRKTASRELRARPTSLG